MAIYVYIDESEKLFSEERYQNFTAITFTDWDLMCNFEKKFCEAKEIISKQTPELMTEDGKEIKGSELWRKREYKIHQELLLKTLTGKTLAGKGSYVSIFSQGVDLVNFEKNYWQNDDSCIKIWTDMKKWLIDDLVISYYKNLIYHWHKNLDGEKVLFEIYIDKETTKNKFGEEIKQILEATENKKIGINVHLGLDSKKYPGIQMADIIANALQRDYKETGKTDEFKKYFKEKTNFKITISKTWKKLEK